MPGRPRQLLRWPTELGPFLVGDQAIAQHDAFVADIHRAVVLCERPVRIELLGPGRAHAAVVPEDAQRPVGVAGGKLVMGDGSQRGGLGADFLGALPVGGAGFDADRVAYLHGLEDGGKLMAADVPEYASAEIPPAAPGKRVIAGVIGPHRRGANPQVPLEVRRAGWGLLGPGNTALGDVRVAVGPCMHLLEGADSAGPDQLGNAAGLFAGLPEIAHLGGYLGLPRDLTDHARLVNRSEEHTSALQSPC